MAFWKHKLKQLKDSPEVGVKYLSDNDHRTSAETSPPSKASDPQRPSVNKQMDARKKHGDIEAWRKGIKGRPLQVFIGVLSHTSKRDAVRYAIGVAERNAINAVNANYAVFPWRDGWVYEVHEGGPMRAFVPTILRAYEQGDHAKPEDLVVYIQTAGRIVRVERTHSGLTSFVMPESFSAPQSDWLEPGPKLKPAVPMRLGTVAAGGAVFATGFIALMLAFIKRPQPPAIHSDRDQIRFEQLPLSQWSMLLSAAANGYVDSLEYTGGQWRISRALHSPDPEAAPLPVAGTP